MAQQKIYTSYESDIQGEYTTEEMQVLYNTLVNKDEYPDFECWLYDMTKSGVFEVTR